nr:hypothetical protein [Kibdelosporangium sp. MJ126-NF4]CTQ89094.1 hypothetical protein [Kibdelosporangium sp. MJ126-NF4]
MLGDQVEVQLAREQRPGAREQRLGLRPRPRPVQGDLPEVPDAGRELHPEQVEQSEVDQRDYVDKSS